MPCSLRLKGRSGAPRPAPDDSEGAAWGRLGQVLESHASLAQMAARPSGSGGPLRRSTGMSMNEPPVVYVNVECVWCKDLVRQALPIEWNTLTIDRVTVSAFFCRSCTVKFNVLVRGVDENEALAADIQEAMNGFDSHVVVDDDEGLPDLDTD